MPANRFNGFTEYGIGIGLRAPHYNHILTRKPVCDWFEIISENFMIDGGRPLRILDEILGQRDQPCGDQERHHQPDPVQDSLDHRRRHRQ